MKIVDSYELAQRRGVWLAGGLTALEMARRSLHAREVINAMHKDYATGELDEYGLRVFYGEACSRWCGSFDLAMAVVRAEMRDAGVL